MTGSKKIKVLIVAPQFPLVGGQSVQAKRLIDKFESEDELQVDLQPTNPRFFPTLQKVKFLRTILTTAKYIFDLFVRIPKYDVVHIFSASYFSFVLAPTPAILISKLFGKKTILNYRSGEAEDHLSRWKTAVKTMKFADKIVAPSGYLVDVFSRFGLEAQSIFNFVEADKFQYRKRERFEPVFLSNRNFESLYNIDCILRAFRLIQDQYAEAKLILAGDGSAREHLEKLAEELDLQNFTFLGRVTQNEMYELYDQADIYLNSPNIDNMPNSIIEAFASGVPVISTNAGGIPYIVENEMNGLLVNVGDHKALADSAIRLIEDNSFASTLVVHAKKGSEKYSWTKVRNQWVKLYDSLRENQK